MELLEKRIVKDGKVVDRDILKVDSFLNHQIDVELLSLLAEEFYNLYKESNINKVLTIEASGIAVAAFTAKLFGVPLVFAKKSKSANISENVYSADVHSFTHGNTNKVIVSKEFLNSCDKVLVIDDFLANGQALIGLKEIVDKAGAEFIGAGIVVEKGFQPGGKMLRDNGMRIESLAIVKSMDPENGIVFEH